MKCGYCGRPLKKNAKFCTYCGNKMNGTGIVDERRTGGSYISSLLALIAVIVVSLAGFTRIIMHTANAVKNNNSTSHSQISGQSDISYSDSATSAAVSTSQTMTTKALTAFDIDKSVSGRWICSSKTSLGYTSKDFGVSAELKLELNANGVFNASYKSVNTGIVERNTAFSGTFMASNGSMTIKPNMRTYDGDYFSRNEIKKLDFTYSINGQNLILSDSDGNKIFFRPLGQED